MKAKIKILNDKVIIPHTSTTKAAGFDIHANIEQSMQVPPHGTIKVPTGFCLTPPEGYFAAIVARSGLATKAGLRPANCVAVCDEDYTGQYFIPLHNDSDEVRSIQPNDRIAQLLFLPYLNLEFEVVDSLEVTERGAGGFGSTGV